MGAPPWTPARGQEPANPLHAKSHLSIVCVEPESVARGGSVVPVVSRVAPVWPPASPPSSLASSLSSSFSLYSSLSRSHKMLFEVRAPVLFCFKGGGRRTRETLEGFRPRGCPTAYSLQGGTLAAA